MLKLNLANYLAFPTTAIEATTTRGARVAQAVRDALGECLPYSEPNMTSLHVHGLHTNVDGIGDYPLKVGHPKETVPYELHVRDDHPTGTFWYHPHTKDAAGLQELGFMAGAVIVDDAAGAWDGTGLAGITDRSVTPTRCVCVSFSYARPCDWRRLPSQGVGAPNRACVCVCVRCRLLLFQWVDFSDDFDNYTALSKVGSAGVARVS